MSRHTKIAFAFATAAILAALIGPLANAWSAAYPQRVVSLAPSVTEALFALGFGDRLVGVTTHCDYPAEVRRIAKVGGFMSPSIEAVVAKRPELVLGVSTATDPLKVREMERFGLNVTVVSLASVKDIVNSIRTMARLLGDIPSGEKLTHRITVQLETVERRVAAAPRRRTLVAVGLRPLVAVGGKNFIDELITLAGGTNIAANAAQPWLNLPDEYIIAKAPQVIIQAGTGSDREVAVKHWADLKSIPAVRERRVYSYPSDKILRPGPRIGEAAQEIARLVHPECFQPTKSGAHEGNGCEGPRP
jgi:iron complex transport system substrate-binding protein